MAGKLIQILFERRAGNQVFVFQPAFIPKRFQSDQKDIAGKSGRAHIRRVSGTDIAQGENLPKGLAGGEKPVYEIIGIPTKIS